MKCHKQARRCTPIIVGLAMGVTNGVERRRAFGGGGGGGGGEPRQCGGITVWGSAELVSSLSGVWGGAVISMKTQCVRYTGVRWMRDEEARSRIKFLSLIDTLK